MQVSPPILFIFQLMEGKDTKTLNIDVFETLFRTNHQFLCMVAMQYVQDKFIAEDLVQDFFIDFWQRRHIIQLTTGFEAYARRAVKYKCIDFLRKNAVAKKRNSMFSILEETQMPNDETDQEEVKHQRYVRIVELIHKLPENRKNIFIMHAVEKLSYADIAKKQSISVNTVKTQLSRAYAALRNKTIITFIGFLLAIARI